MQYRTIGDALVIEFWVRKEEQMNKKFEFEETLASGLKYTEETGRTARSLPIRECSLWQAGVDEPISDLTILSFRQRFGAVAIPAEGIAGVETQPAFRRQGHVRALLTREHVNVDVNIDLESHDSHVLTELGELFFEACTQKNHT